MEKRQEILNNAIYDNMNIENIRPYMPANGTDGTFFMAEYCDNCAKDVAADCEILTKAYCGEQPTEWICLNDKPTCTAFEKSIDLEM
jgi:hypothetical protein